MGIQSGYLRTLRPFFYSLLMGACLTVLGTNCASTPKYNKEDCPLYTDLGPLRVNPAGALDRHLHVELAFKVCPPDEGLAEIRRKRIELKHALIALLSSKTTEELEHPLRVEYLRREILLLVNRELLKKSRLLQVSVTGFELR